MTRRFGVVLLAVAGVVLAGLIVVLDRSAPRLAGRASRPARGGAMPVAGAFLSADEALKTPGFRIAATHYWQKRWNYNFWSGFKPGELDGDFRLIRSLSFNTVITSVPWGYFQTVAFPPTYSERAFAKLETFLEAAARHDLYVALRVGTPELIPEGIWGGSYNNPVTIYDDRELDAYCDLYREVARRTADQTNLLFIFGSWEDIGYLGPLKMERRGNHPLYLAPFVRYLESEGLEHWNRRWGTSYRSIAQIPVPAYGDLAAWDFLDFASERLVTVVLPRIARAAREGNPGVGLGFEIRVDSEPVWVRGRDEGPDWYPHHRTWNLPEEFGIIGAYFNPYWKAPNDGGHIAPDDAVRNLSRLLDEIEEHTDGRPIFFDQLNFTDSTPYFSYNSRLRDEEAIADFLELALTELHQRSIGYAVWSFRAYEAGVLYNPTFEDGLHGWQSTQGSTTKARVVMDVVRREHCALLDPGAALQRTERAVWNPGCHSPEVPYTLRIDARGNPGSRLEVHLEGLNPEDRGRVSRTSLEIEPTEDWHEYVREVPFSAVFRLTLESVGDSTVAVDEVTLFNHVQTAAVLGPQGEEIGRRAEVLGRINRSWADRVGLFETSAASSWDRDRLKRLPAVYEDGWVGAEVEIPLHVPWVHTRVLVDLYVPDQEGWRDGNEVEVRDGGEVVARRTVGVGSQRLEVDLPNHTNPGPRFLRLSFARTVCPVETDQGSMDDRRLTAVLRGVRALPAAGREDLCWTGEISGDPAAVFVETSPAACALGATVLAHSDGGGLVRGRIDGDGMALLQVAASPSSEPQRRLFVELLHETATITEVRVEGSVKASGGGP